MDDGILSGKYSESYFESNRRMAKEEIIELEGKVVEVLPGGRFKVELDNGHVINGILSGKMRKNNIKVIQFDRVKVDMTPYDLTKGRITFRYK